MGKLVLSSVFVLRIEGLTGLGVSVLFGGESKADDESEFIEDVRSEGRGGSLTCFVRCAACASMLGTGGELRP